MNKTFRILIVCLLICLLVPIIYGCSETESEQPAGYKIHNISSHYDENTDGSTILAGYIFKKENKTEPITYYFGENELTLKYLDSEVYSGNLQVIDYYAVTHINGVETDWSNISYASEYELRLFENGELFAFLAHGDALFGECVIDLSMTKEEVFNKIKEILKDFIDIPEDYSAYFFEQTSEHVIKLAACNIDDSKTKITELIECRFDENGKFYGFWIWRMDPKLSSFTDFPSNEKVMPDIKAHINNNLPDGTKLDSCEITNVEFIVYEDKVCGLYDITVQLRGEEGDYEDILRVLVELEKGKK